MDLLHSRIPQAQNLQSIGLEVGVSVDGLADLGVGTDDLRDLIRVIENERQVENLQARRDRRELRARRGEHLHGVGLQRLHLVLVAVEFRVREHLDLDAAIGLLFDLLGEEVSGESLRRARRSHMGEAQFELLLLAAARGIAPAQGQQADRQAGNQRFPPGSSYRRHRQLQ
nr:hypothetical protein [Brevibacterium aurantiacum]